MRSVLVLVVSVSGDLHCTCKVQNPEFDWFISGFGLLCTDMPGLETCS